MVGRRALLAIALVIGIAIGFAGGYLASRSMGTAIHRAATPAVCMGGVETVTVVRTPALTYSFLSAGGKVMVSASIIGFRIAVTVDGRSLVASLNPSSLILSFSSPIRINGTVVVKVYGSRGRLLAYGRMSISREVTSLEIPIHWLTPSPEMMKVRKVVVYLSSPAINALGS